MEFVEPMKAKLVSDPPEGDLIYEIKHDPTVSTPVTWDEVETAFKRKRASLLAFEADGVLKRVQMKGDLFAPVLLLKQKLPSLESFNL